MDKKKILFAALFLTILLLVPFTAVGNQPIVYAGDSEDDQIIEKASPSLFRPLCFITDKMYQIFLEIAKDYDYNCVHYQDFEACDKALFFYGLAGKAWVRYVGLRCEDCV